MSARRPQTKTPKGTLLSLSDLERDNDVPLGGRQPQRETPAEVSTTERFCSASASE